MTGKILYIYTKTQIAQHIKTGGLGKGWNGASLFSCAEQPGAWSIIILYSWQRMSILYFSRLWTASTVK